MASDPALQAFLAEQAADYRRSLPARLAAVESAWAAIAAGPEAAGATDALDALRRAAHGLAGSAATFGLPRLGELARQVEDACDPAVPPTPGWTAALAAPVARLREALAAAQAGA